MPTQVILLERIEKLGAMGDVVSVKPGYARNYLLPQKKAMRATDSNIAYFEKQKAALQKLNDEKKADAEKRSKAIVGKTYAIIRQAGESGQLYGSVSAKDIAEIITEKTGEKIERNMVQINQSFKTIGLFPMVIALHSEVKVNVTINVARTEDEARQQEKTGKALIADEAADIAAEKAAAAEKAKAALMDKEALDAEIEAETSAAEKAAKDDAKSAEKSKARANKKASAATDSSNEAPAEDNNADE